MEELLEDMKERLISIFGEGILSDEEFKRAYEDNLKYVMTIYKLHENRKRALGNRVKVLRVLIRKRHEDKRLKMNEFEFNVRVEKYLDNLLAKYQYNLERVIEIIREKGST